MNTGASEGDGDPLAGLSPESRASIERQARGMAAENKAVAAARREPLPGPMAGAFASLPGSVAGLKVRPLVHYDFIILRRLDSPLLKQMARASGQRRRRKETPFSDEEAYAMVYQFTRPAREVAAWWDGQRDGAKAATEFRRLAREEIGLSLGPVEVGLLVALVEREFVSSFSTAINYASKGDSGETVFTPPPPEPTTASAGGSTTSVGSPAPIRD